MTSRSFYSIVALFFALLVLFRNVFVTTLGVLGELFSLLPLLVLSAFGFFFIIKRMTKINFAIFLFISYLLCSTFFFFLGNPNTYLLTPFVSLFQYVSPILAAYILLKVVSLSKIKNLLIFVVCANAIGGIIQFFVSKNIFGLISNNVYDGNIVYAANVEARAISFFASPQSLAILMAIGLCFIITYQKRLRFVTATLTFFVGLLTASKAFFVYLVSYFLLSTKLINLLVIVLITYISFLSITDDFFLYYYISRILDVFEKVSSLQSYYTFTIWMDFISYTSDIFIIVFGNGIGLISSFSQSTYDYKILNGSTESFLLQLYFEVGLIGLLLFMNMFFILPFLAHLKSRTKPKSRTIFLILALFFNMAFTPAAFGFSFAFFMYLTYFFILKESNVKF